SVSRRALGIVAAAAACASTASSGIGVFLTESAVAMGLSEANAGLLLAAGSVAGIVTRVATGIRADNHGGPQLRTIWVMMATGAVSMALASIGSVPLLVLGAVGAFAGGWGWTGLLFLTLVRANPSTPGAGAGLGLLGLAIGNGLGPLAFGAAAEQLSFTAAWAGAAVLAGAGALLARSAAPPLEPARICFPRPTEEIGNRRAREYVLSPMVRILLGAAVLCFVVIAAGAPARAASHNTYVDDDRSRYEGYIEAASEAGLVSGCNPPENTRFCPHRVVSRGEMAIMLVRALGLASDGGDHFSDDDGIAAEPSIDALAAAGVTDGCAPGKFCPDAALTRGQMAQLIADALGWRQVAGAERYRDLEGS